MTNTESTSMSVWTAHGWEIRPVNLPTITVAPPVAAQELVEVDAVRREPAEGQEDEPLFGSHIREAARVIRKIVM